MSRWRVAVVLLLVAVPLLVWLVLGWVYLWQTGAGFYVWWITSASLAAGYFLGHYWLRKRQLLPKVDFTVPPHWTERDRAAWKLVEAQAAKLAETEHRQPAELDFYANLSKEMADELAHFYHPETKDPIGSLTVPEVLAVVELVAHDLSQMVRAKVPAGHMLTIDQWRWAKDASSTATRVYQAASKFYWLGALVLDPISAGARYAASQAGLTTPLQLIQQDLVAWFHTAFVERLGSYLIDLYSGRLKVGADRYRELTEPKPLDSSPEQKAPIDRVTLTILGQTKMGKSSFINALLGEERARADVVPATDTVTRYTLLREGLPTLVLLDTVGYGHAGPKEDQLKATLEAARQSDLLVLVLHARSPARQADLEVLQKLDAWFRERPDLKKPPVVAVLTHIDLLSPAMEWSPPYDWQNPKRPKEVQIHEAVAVAREQLGPLVADAVPVCTAPEKTFGIVEAFLPALAEQLGEARGVALLRALRSEIDTGKVRKVFGQLAEVGKQAAKVWLESRRKK